MVRPGATKPRDLDYSNLGNAGRRTGITLQERERDEDGMEEMDGLFSSPEKSPTKVNGFDDDEEDSIGSDMMSIDEGNGPAPSDFLNSIKRPGTALGRSPNKYRGAPAQYSYNPRSSPEVAEDSVSSSPSDGKGLNGSARQEASPLTTRSVNAGTNRPQKVKPQTTTSNPVVDDFSDDERDENSYAFQPAENGFDDSLDAGNETVMPEEDVSNNSADNTDAENESPQVAPGPSQTTKAAAASSSKPKANNKRPAPQATNGDDIQPKRGARGRPPKSQRAGPEESTNGRPAKIAKTNGKPKPAHEPLDPELNKVVENYAQRPGPLKGRSLYILKREDPEDTSSTHTRSGRVSIRPLAYWKNERCVFGDGEAAEGQRYPMSTIKEVVRAEELEPNGPRKSKKGKRPGSKSKSKKNREESSDEEDDPNADVWEKEDGILHGYVPSWDSKTQRNTGSEEIVDIAYAPSGIKTREVKDSTFRFAKLLSSHFIGSGVVELPKDGVKRPKNSKKMHMVFYVTHGRVQVDISGVQFSAGKGSVFQVPRGNLYSFQNPYEREARLFFTQGCIPGEGEASDNSESQNAAAESEFEAGSAPKPSSNASKSRGRPKGKAKAK